MMADRYDWIPLHKIDRDPLFHLRQRWDPQRDADLPTLARSLEGPEGLIHPIVVVTRSTPTTFGRLYTLVAGHRRLAAAEHVRWERILARVLPACDLTLPAERLRLLAMAIRENTERVPLDATDRRVALQRLKMLYDEVYPVRRPSTSGDNPFAGEALAFPRWAAGVTQIPERTIRHDLRRLFSVPPGQAGRQAAGELATMPSDAAEEPLPYALAMGQQASAALQALHATLTPEQRGQIPLEQHRQLVDTLQELQATVSMAWTATTVPTARSLDAFALMVQQRVPPLLGALRGLATSPRMEWEQAPPLLLNTLQEAMTTLLHHWSQIEAALDVTRSQPPAASRPRRQEGSA